MSTRTRHDCEICTWADEMLGQEATDPAMAESTLAHVGIGL